MSAKESESPASLKEKIMITVMGVFAVAGITFICLMVSNAREPTPQEECRTMIEMIEVPQYGNPHPRRVFELGCDTMLEFRKYRKAVVKH